VTSLHYPSLLHRAVSTPWAIEEQKLHEIVGFLSAKASGTAPDAVFDDRAEEPAPVQRGTTRVIPVMGTLSLRAGSLARSSGVVSAETLGREIDQAAADRSVETILLHIDSPGGAVSGIEELAAKVRAATNEKRVVAFANATAASAAYWIASQADEIVVTPSGRVGSIGVIAIHQDVSAALQKKGVAVTVIKAGAHKGEGHPFGPLSDEDQAAFQARVDHGYASFVDAVARGRDVSPAAVRSGFGQGRIVLAHEAVQLGMADRVATFDELFAPVGAKQGNSMAAQSRDEFLSHLATEIRNTAEALR